MKHALLALSLFALAWCSCSKDHSPTDEEILTQRIEDIIPARYLDTLKQFGLEVHLGTQPPNVEGTYSVKPLILDTSNIPADIPGTRFRDATVNFSEQSSKDFSIKLIGANLLNTADTSIATAISGSGNNFTVYGKVKSVSGSKSAIFAIVLTATKEGNDLKNFKLGIINIDNSNGQGVFIQEGQGRVGYDSDFISEQTSDKRTAPERMQDLQPLGSRLQ